MVSNPPTVNYTCALQHRGIHRLDFTKQPKTILYSVQVALICRISLPSSFLGNYVYWSGTQ